MTGFPTAPRAANRRSFGRRLSASLKLGVRSLLLHRLRSLLTVLGLVFGVASVVVMLAVAEGASQEAQRQIADLGATNVILRSVKPKEQETENVDSLLLEYGLSYDDLDRVKATLPQAVQVTAFRQFEERAHHGPNSKTVRVVGCQPSYATANRLRPSAGRFLTAVDIDIGDNVAVIADDVAKDLFPLEDPVGRSISLGPTQIYRVVGVTRSRAPSAAVGGSLEAQDFNADVYIPITTDRRRFGETLEFIKPGGITYEKLELSQITVQMATMEEVPAAAEALESLLAWFHVKKDFGVTVPLELLEKAKATKRLFNVVLGSIAAISLLVGGIGIMNIMLATVTERTREIGVRRALGATQADITMQFLAETGVLSAVGGLIGVALGVVAPFLLTRFSGIHTVFIAWSPIAAFSMALIVGIAFGLFPARRAALMNPIDALRAE